MDEQTRQQEATNLNALIKDLNWGQVRPVIFLFRVVPA